MYCFLGHLVVHPQKDKILSYPLFILLSGSRREGWLLQILISEAKEEGVLNSKLEWIYLLSKEENYVLSIFYVIEWTTKGGRIVIWNFE